VESSTTSATTLCFQQKRQNEMLALSHSPSYRGHYQSHVDY